MSTLKSVSPLTSPDVTGPAITSRKTGPRSSLLKSVATAKPQAKAGDGPPLFRLEEQAADLSRLLELKRQMKDLEAEVKMLESDLKPAAELLRMQASQLRGENLSSIKVNGVAYRTQFRYSPVTDAELVQRIESAAWVEAGTYFKEKYSIEVDVTQLDDAVVEALLAQGAVFHTVFEATRQFHDDRTLRADVAELDVGPLKPVAFFQE